MQATIDVGDIIAEQSGYDPQDCYVYSGNDDTDFSSNQHQGLTLEDEEFVWECQQLLREGQFRHRHLLRGERGPRGDPRGDSRARFRRDGRRRGVSSSVGSRPGGTSAIRASSSSSLIHRQSRDPRMTTDVDLTERARAGDRQRLFQGGFPVVERPFEPAAAAMRERGSTSTQRSYSRRFRTWTSAVFSRGSVRSSTPRRSAARRRWSPCTPRPVRRDRRAG